MAEPATDNFFVNWTEVFGTKRPAPPDEGGTLDAEAFAPLREAHRALDAATVSWIGELVDQSRRAGVSIHATEVRTERRLGIGRGLVALAVAGYDDDLLVRQLAATVARDDRLLAPGLTAGAALGSLDARAGDEVRRDMRTGRQGSEQSRPDRHLKHSRYTSETDALRASVDTSNKQGETQMGIQLEQPAAPGLPGPKFAEPGGYVDVGIIDVETVQSRDYDTGDPKKWDDGTPVSHPRITGVVLAAQGARTGRDDDERDIAVGETIQIHADGGRIYTWRDAIKEHGPVEVGDVLRWKFDRTEAPRNRMHNPRKVFVAQLRKARGDDGDLVARCEALYHERRKGIVLMAQEDLEDPF